MLNDFSAVKVDSQKPTVTPQPTAAAEPSNAPPLSTDPPANPDEAFSEEDFAKQLQAGMADLLGELEKSVSLSSPLGPFPVALTALS